MKKISIITSLIASVLSGGYDGSNPQKVREDYSTNDTPSHFGSVTQTWKEACDCSRSKKHRFYRRSLTPIDDEKVNAEPALGTEVPKASYDHTPWYLTETKKTSDKKSNSDFDYPTPVDPPSSSNGTLASTPQYGEDTWAEPKNSDQVNNKYYGAPDYKIDRKDYDYQKESDDKDIKDYKDEYLKDYKDEYLKDYKDEYLKDYKDEYLKDYKNGYLKDYKDIKNYKDKDLKDEYYYPPSASVNYPEPTNNHEYDPRNFHKSYSSYNPRPTSAEHGPYLPKYDNSYSSYYPRSSIISNYNYPKSSYSSYYSRPTSARYGPYYPEDDYSSYDPRPASDKYGPYGPYGPDEDYRRGPYYTRPSSDNSGPYPEDGRIFYDPQPSSGNYKAYPDEDYSRSPYYPQSRSGKYKSYPGEIYSGISHDHQTGFNKNNPNYPEDYYSRSSYDPRPRSDQYKPQYPKGDDRYRPYRPESESVYYPRIINNDDHRPLISPDPFTSADSGYDDRHLPHPFSADGVDYIKRFKVTRHGVDSIGDEYEDDCRCRRFPVTP